MSRLGFCCGADALYLGTTAFVAAGTEMTMSRRSAAQPLLGHILQWRILLLLFFCAALALAHGEDQCRSRLPSLRLSLTAAFNIPR